MPRRRVAPRARPPLRTSPDRVEPRADGEWNVRRLTGAAATKDYRCPGCHQLIRPATPHVLVWPVLKPLLSDEAIDERRHWHTSCWTRRR
jgi:hypothetical protein